MSFHVNMYDLALWKYHSVTVFNKFRSCYHKCIKKFFGFKRMGSMSGTLRFIIAQHKYRLT